MTFSQKTSPLIKKTFLTLAAAAMLAPAAAIAGDAPTGFTVKTVNNGYAKISVRAFQDGDFERSAAYSRRALEDGMSKTRRAIVYNNLCAAEAALGNMDAAAQACDKALEMRPGYDIAEANQSALTVLLAQK